MTGRQLKLNDFFNARHVAMAMPSTSTAVDDPLPQPSPEAESMEEPQPQVPPSPVGRPRVATHPRNTTDAWLARQLRERAWLRHNPEKNTLYCAWCSLDAPYKLKDSPYVVGIPSHKWKLDSIEKHEDAKRHCMAKSAF